MYPRIPKSEKTSVSNLRIILLGVSQWREAFGLDGDLEVWQTLKKGKAYEFIFIFIFSFSKLCDNYIYNHIHRGKKNLFLVYVLHVLYELYDYKNNFIRHMYITSSSRRFFPVCNKNYFKKNSDFLFL